MDKYLGLTTRFTQALLALALCATGSVWAQGAKPKEKSQELNTTYIRDMRDSFEFPPPDFEHKEKGLQQITLERVLSARELGRVKMEMINGNLEKAKLRLLQARNTQKFSRSIQYRYLAMIHFIQGDYRQSLDILNSKEMRAPQAQDNVCLLRTLNLIILDQPQEAAAEWKSCQSFIAGKDGSNNLWIGSLLQLKLAQESGARPAPLKGVSIENEEGDALRLYLKLALYLGEPELVLERVPYLSVAAFENPRIRELLGLLYFQNLEFVKAYNLIEDLSTPNSENIKGNILLAQDKLELAYAQFKLALARKSNSQNSLERIAPTAWRLNQWSEGAEFSARLEETAANRDSKRALEAAFLTKDERPKEALRKLDSIVDRNETGQAMEVNQLYTYNYLAAEQSSSAYERADLACRQLDAFSCWIRSHLLIWEDFSLLAKREELIYQNSPNLLLEFRSGFKKEPIKEKVYIDQKEIEELEDAQIQLLPSAGGL